MTRDSAETLVRVRQALAGLAFEADAHDDERGLEKFGGLCAAMGDMPEMVLAEQIILAQEEAAA